LAGGAGPDGKADAAWNGHRFLWEDGSLVQDADGKVTQPSLVTAENDRLQKELADTKAQLARVTTENKRRKRDAEEAQETEERLEEEVAETRTQLARVTAETKAFRSAYLRAEKQRLELKQTTTYLRGRVAELQEEPPRKKSRKDE